MEYLQYIFILLVMLYKSVDVSSESCQPIVDSLRKYGNVYTYKDVCYVFINHEKTWVDARHRCEAWGGDLVHIPDQGTMQFIKGIMDNQLRWRNNGVWIGLHNRGSGGWRWTTGQRQTFNYWDSGQPSKTFGFISFEDCACMRRGDGWRWHDYMCDNGMFTYKYICQFRMLPTTTTTTTTTAKPSTTTVTTVTTTKTSTSTASSSTVTSSSVMNLFNPVYNKPLETADTVHDVVIKGYPSDSSIGIQVAKNIERSRQGDGLSDGSKGVIIGLVLGGFIVLVIVCMGFILFRRRRKRKRDSDNLVVQFENTDYMQGYTQGYSPVSQNEANGHVSNGTRPESHIYMDTNERNRLYEQMTKDVDHGVNNYDKLKPKGACAGATKGYTDECEESDLKKERVNLPEEAEGSRLNNDNEYIDMAANKLKLTNLEANTRRVEKQNNLQQPLYSNETFQRERLQTPTEDELEILDYEESTPLDNGQLQVLDYEESTTKKVDPLYDTIH
ncbi:uncharacterized protein [Mytilus edulis]|uniref:uncharacterized protein isoform X1 n=1 Tax=Mytilus edulis TaxID=6550 RepID=UPI0039EF5840